ncbi:TraR/DksA family transcriptional regulator [Aquisalinus flavus]|uniref:Molecular chaperone DnaK n=1 Tax=Aquisalinus flavus TaxID=1526572 RepID=A0A8J2V2U6_9PROT|nr:TraR/DksA C4-type zinc finger protein [Aquisalinus flavus]MBD0427907.1 TraR/DksA C4-type zinc finger protein [Aquisalinus flavus]UNE47666.1 TraR/DksA family transcriptional regulator [Aquisalinus flavus]GGD04810.1 molecular chaperone DnaK [Aquisalinus flavus]
MTETPEQWRVRIEDLREDLLARSGISADARKPVELDQQSVGRLSRQDALQQQAMANAQEQLRKRELKRIDQALARLQAGEFGYCLDCGEEIAPKRLAIDPLAELCVDCKG